MYLLRNLMLVIVRHCLFGCSLSDKVLNQTLPVHRVNLMATASMSISASSTCTRYVPDRLNLSNTFHVQLYWTCNRSTVAGSCLLSRCVEVGLGRSFMIDDQRHSKIKRLTITEARCTWYPESLALWFWVSASSLIKPFGDFERSLEFNLQSEYELYLIEESIGHEKFTYDDSSAFAFTKDFHDLENVLGHTQSKTHLEVCIRRKLAIWLKFKNATFDYVHRVSR